MDVLQEQLKDLDFEGFDFGFAQYNDSDINIVERKDLSDTLENEYKCIIDCENETQLQAIYEEMTERGFKCTISTL